MSDATPTPASIKAIPIFAVDDLAATIRWYEEILGWTTSFVWPMPDSGEPPWYAGVRDGEVEIHLNSSDEDATAGKVYIFANDVDAICEAIKARGGEIAVEPKTYDYGMRDFALHDPSGNQITFGMSAREE